MPLVLAIEPDARQGAVLQRIVRDHVHAELLLVDSPDAAVAALATHIPDVILVSMLLAPADEEDLIRAAAFSRRWTPHPDLHDSAVRLDAGRPRGCERPLPRETPQEEGTRRRTDPGLRSRPVRDGSRDLPESRPGAEGTERGRCRPDAPPVAAGGRRGGICRRRRRRGHAGRCGGGGLVLGLTLRMASDRGDEADDQVGEGSD